MMPRSRIPLLTKIYLAILGCLGAMLLILVLLRAADISFDLNDIRAIFPGRGRDAAAQLTTTPQQTPTSQPTYPPNVPWLRALTNAPIYDVPGGTSQPAAVLVNGETAPVLGASADRQWWAIPVPYFVNGRGWVAAGQVTVENGDQAPVLDLGATTGSQALPTEQIPVAQAVANVNVRSGPDLNFDKIGMLNNGQEAEIVGISQDGMWWVIRLPGDQGKTGWVAKDYIVARNDDNVPVMTLETAAKGGAVASPQPGKAFLTAAWTVNIRAGPGKEYAVVGTLQQNQTAEIVGVSEDTIWWAIRFENGDSDTGWVAAAFVEAQNTQNVPVIK
jgi:uncharacterized protein YraI